MEKNSFKSNSLKDHGGIVTKAIRDSNNKRIHGSQSYEEDYMNGFSWPPRSYTCSFCKREFRSAQALGGHMNVHRKDRARLKSSPPRDHGQYTSTMLNLNLKPNPNPNFSSSSTSSSSSSPTSLKSPCRSTFPTLISLPPPPPPSAIFSVASTENMKWFPGGALFKHPLNLKDSDLRAKLKSVKSLRGVGVHQCDGFIGQEDQHGCMKTLKRAADHQIVNLDLEIGLLGDSNKEDLDLELRLGCS